MSGVSALMAAGLFSVNGGSDINPCYEITSPVFDEVLIKLDPKYYFGKDFKIITHRDNASDCYIQRASLNGKEHNSYRLPHNAYSKGGVLELWLGPEPNKSWGITF